VELPEIADVNTDTTSTPLRTGPYEGGEQVSMVPAVRVSRSWRTIYNVDRELIVRFVAMRYRSWGLGKMTCELTTLQDE